jgi:hypothetical protein
LIFSLYPFLEKFRRRNFPRLVQKRPIREALCEVSMAGIVATAFGAKRGHSKAAAFSPSFEQK